MPSETTVPRMPGGEEAVAVKGVGPNLHVGGRLGRGEGDE